MANKKVLLGPSPRRCGMCKGNGGSPSVPCVTCNGSGWTMPYASPVVKKTTASSGEHEDIPF